MPGTICLEEFGAAENVSQLPCSMLSPAQVGVPPLDLKQLTFQWGGHCFHTACINKWVLEAGQGFQCVAMDFSPSLAFSTEKVFSMLQVGDNIVNAWFVPTWFFSRVFHHTGEDSQWVAVFPLHMGWNHQPVLQVCHRPYPMTLVRTGAVPSAAPWKCQGAGWEGWDAHLCLQTYSQGSFLFCRVFGLLMGQWDQPPDL